MRFIKKTDCYLDTKTGLEWSLGNCGLAPWDKALELCVNMKGAWGLPSIEELLTLVDYERFNPATELPGMLSSDYWSSTTIAYNTSHAWSVCFNYGHDYSDYKSDSYYVRAVRNGARRLK